MVFFILFNIDENGYSLNNRNVSAFKMFHLIRAILFIIKLITFSTQ